MGFVFVEVKHRLSLGLASACAAWVFVVVCKTLGLLQTAEILHHDAVAAALAHPETASDVVVVTVDDTDLGRWGWPLPDGVIADIVSAIGASDPAAIGLDIYRDNAVGAGAEALERAFAQTDAVIISKLGPDGGLSISPPAYLGATNQFGFSDIPIDTDGAARRALLLINSGGQLYLSFPMQLALRALGQTGLRAWPDDPRVIVLGQIPIPSLGQQFGGYHRLDAAGYQVPLRFEYQLPIARTVAARDLLGAPPDPGLAGKVVIVGVHSDSIKDYFRTPLNSGNGDRFTYGSLVHASITQHLIDVAKGNSRMLRDVSPMLHMGLVFAAALIGAGLGQIARAGWQVAFLLPGAIVLAGGMMSYALTFGLWLPVVPSMLALTLGFSICFGTLSVLARRQRNVMATLFSDHLSPDLAMQIWQNRSLFMTGGKPQPKELDTTLIFVDIAGSTAIGGITEPAAYVAWISRVLDALSRVAREHGGFIEKFTGDGLLVAFGAPLPRRDMGEITQDALAACRCAIAMANRVEELNQEDQDVPAYNVRLGLHSGIVYGGMLGNRGTLQYNLVGDTVNVTARVEAFGKKVTRTSDSAALICISDVAVARTGGQVDVAPIGTLLHDDGTTELQVFELQRSR